MNNLSKVDGIVRPLRDSDLDQVVAIDAGHVGEPRRRFFEKRLAQAKRHPDDHVHVGVLSNNELVGFALARILRGEFGRAQTIAVLDAVGVDYESQARGIGRLLIGGIAGILRAKGVQSVQSQADWSDHALLRFFDSSGFALAPRLMLERSVLTPLAEPSEAE
jgi:L-amino acid N-acyltransferase YncA